MKHLTEEELIEHYYSEDSNRAGAEGHLRSCRHCSQAYEELVQVLSNVRTPEAPARSAEYGMQVWRSIEGSLPAYQPRRKIAYISWPRFAYAAACLLFLSAAFVGGRIWERVHTKTTIASSPQQTRERVVLFVLDNHLDRSERLLVQLNHAALENDDAGLPLQAEARQLLTDNRLYRESITRTNNDPLLDAALDHLQRVLLEVANSPDQLSAKDVARIEKEMNTQGLLFQIRVLRTKVSEQNLNAQAIRKGAIT